MDEAISTENKEIGISNEIRGDVTLGSVDPRTLSKENFKASPDLLFHGSGKEITFSQNFDYQNNPDDNSSKIGFGFYATPNRKDAELYSLAFARKGEKPTIIEMLPYQAKMLDLRRKSDLSHNGSVPQNIFKDWINYYQKWFDTAYGENGKRRPEFFKWMDSNYLGSLRARSNATSIDLRSMLSEDGFGKNTEHAADTFREFMQQEGYDGIIYVEGGDHLGHKSPVSYVFYNLKKIGTFEAWHTNKS